MTHVYAFVGGASIYGIVSYAARTIPVPDNPWLHWLAGIFQYAMSNPDRGYLHFGRPAA